MFKLRTLVGLVLGFCSTASIGACTPPASRGSCTVDDDCIGRSQYCDVQTHSCEEDEKDYTSTADDAPPGAFTNKVIPFFRGEICTAKNANVKAGSPIPITYRPCLHECMTAGNPFFQHQWSCLSGLCSAMTVFYTVGGGGQDGKPACPADAWGQFPRSECTYPIEAHTAIGPVELNGSPVQGTLGIEIPFLTNSDLTLISSYKGLDLPSQEQSATQECNADCGSKPEGDRSTCLENCLINELAWEYLEQDDRILPIDLQEGHPVPPEDCSADNMAQCECFPIGFG